MLLEIAEIEVRPGAEEAFSAAMREVGLEQLSACEGVVSIRFGRGVENPSKFTFNVVWTSMEAHDSARKLDSFGRFRAAFGDLGVGGTMSHYVMDEAIPGRAA
ncbi:MULTISPECIES: antibiotic biosynthesis monooxygenase family protein [unclassified Novosphingobium]|uniref:putative quinol monooxygenase n=1 Tax=unclassified Novosphingobium TaxID=2644732 RepID=UPI0006C84C10|nr:MULTISPECIES: antibiotic biosynthesis monooxygenase family protein [unclassified Novosphingobium]KPH59279.1 antibiotic biosynthesis monooxygenase [Novosphingobium sp. ST904]MPS71137.1 antibiotic biosynthesis monooxygenase [Novosphingobium sp.]TCM37662.1 quinol monooxygenase YgiN [Novosphingobium sp. ST904]